MPWPFVRRATHEALQARYIGANRRAERLHKSYLALLDESTRRREVNEALAEANALLAAKVAELKHQLQPRDPKTGRMLPRANGASR